MKKILALLLAVLLLQAAVPAAAEGGDAPMGEKTASPADLDPNNRDTTVTLSLPSDKAVDEDDDDTCLILEGEVKDKIEDEFELKSPLGDPFTITVGGTEQSRTKIAEDLWGFGNYNKEENSYPYTVSYEPKSKTIKWMINVPVKISEQVKISYVLTIKEDAVTRTYDTNKNAVLEYTGVTGDPPPHGIFIFPVPKVYYTVTEATVVKIWDDDNDWDGFRPDSITARLSNGTEVILNEGNGWTATVKRLPMYENGEEIEYTWSETVSSDEYKLTGYKTEDTVTKITNSHTPTTKPTLTITAKDQTYDDTGGTVGPGDLIIEDTEEMTKWITSEGLRSGDKIAQIEVDGQAEGVGEHPDRIVPGAAVVKDSAGNVVTDEYDIRYVPGKITIKKVSYSVTKGAGATWEQGSGKPMEYVVKRTPNDGKTFELFKKLQRNGSDVPASAYTASSGSLKLSLSASYLETLSEGAHTLRFRFEDGYAETRLTVRAPAQEVPKTGDTHRPGLWALTCLTALGGACLAGAALGKRAKREE